MCRMNPTYVTAGEVAAELRVSRPTVIRWCQNGTLPASQFGSRWRILAADFEAFKAAAKVAK